MLLNIHICFISWFAKNDSFLHKKPEKEEPTHLAWDGQEREEVHEPMSILTTFLIFALTKTTVQYTADTDASGAQIESGPLR